jgi:hypothetical protein
MLTIDLCSAFVHGVVSSVVEWVVTEYHADRTWQARLVARHPSLFLSGHNQTCIPGLPLVGDGWRDLVERAVDRVANTLAAAASGSVTLVQVKEKFGVARIYWNGTGLTKATENAIADIIAKAEGRSACTCETCGRSGVLHQVGGQLLTACAEHSKGTLVPVSPGWENLNLVRGFRDGNAAILVCRRYDRARDSFVDVDPVSLGIEE